MRILQRLALKRDSVLIYMRTQELRLFFFFLKKTIRTATLTLQDFFPECTEPDGGPSFKFSAIFLGQTALADKFSQTHVVTQPERLILVRWMSLETQ